MGGAATEARLLPQCAAAFIVNLLTLANGYCLGWPAVALPILESNGTALEPPPLGAPLSKAEASWVASAMILSSAATPPLYSAAGRRWGLKVAGYLSAGPFMLSGVVLLFGRSLPAVLAGRVLAGVGSGGCLAVAPHYVAEVVQERYRGALGTALAIELNAGILLAYLVGAVAKYRTVCTVCVVLPTLYAAASSFLPETPQFLVSRGRLAEAARSLHWLRGADCDVDAELEQLKAATSGGRRQAATVAQFFRDRAARRGFAVVVALIANLQLCGNLVVLHYAVELFEAAGGTLPAAWSAVCVGAMQLAAACLTSQLVERAGRRPLLLASNAGIAASLVALGGYFYAQAAGMDVAAISWLPIASLSLYVILCNLGIAALVFVVLNEMFAPDMHQVAVSLGVPSFLVAAFAVLKVYVYLLAWLDTYGCYWFFAACTLAINVYIFFFLPETKGRPIPDIVEELSGALKKDKAERKYDQVAMSEKV